MRQEVAPPLAHGRYRLTEVLGAGGMAVVYRAYDTRLRTARAVKVLKSELDDRARERFDVEARTMARLHHPNVVLVHDVADDADRAYLVMELIEGGSVSDRMAAFGPLPQRMACEVTMAVLDGLGAAHEKGIVHRDVKPHNIMVSDDGVPKVTDFGIAQVSDFSSTKTGTVIGTWAYMAPEQRADARSVDARADLFGVGCTLYNMLTGTEPFDLYNAEIRDEVFADVPEAFHELIQKACRYKPDDRFSSAAEMQAALGELLPSLPEDPPETPPLGISLENERADIVPTMLGMYMSADVSNPTLARPPKKVAAKPSWLLIGFAAAALLFVTLGAVAGLAVTGSVLGMSRWGLDAATVDDPGEPAEPEVEAPPTEDPPLLAVGTVDPDEAANPHDAGALEGDPLEADPLEVDVGDGMDEPIEDEPVEEEPDATEPVVAPEPDPPDAGLTTSQIPPPAEPAPAPKEAVAPKEEPPPEPTGPPRKDGHFRVSINTRPWSMIGIDGGQYHRSPHIYELPPGRYTVELANGLDPSQDKSIPLVVSDGDRTLCWDFETESACR